MFSFYTPVKSSTPVAKIEQRFSRNSRKENSDLRYGKDSHSSYFLNDESCEPTEEETDSWASLVHPDEIEVSSVALDSNKKGLIRRQSFDLEDLLAESNLEDGDAPACEKRYERKLEPANLSKALPLESFLDGKLDKQTNDAEGRRKATLETPLPSKTVEIIQGPVCFEPKPRPTRRTVAFAALPEKMYFQDQHAADLSGDLSLDITDLWANDSICSREKDDILNCSFAMTSQKSSTSSLVSNLERKLEGKRAALSLSCSFGSNSSCD